MFSENVIEHILAHADRCGFDELWYVGIRAWARRHPYNGEELNFATQWWTFIEAMDTSEAQRAMNELMRLGFRPVDGNYTGKQVYTFAKLHPKP